MRRKTRYSPQFVTTATTLLLSLPVVYFTTFYCAPIHGPYSYPERVRVHWIVAAIAVAWLVWKWIRGRSLAHTPLDGPLAALVIALGVSALGSTDRRTSAEAFFGALSCGLTFYFLLDLGRSKRMRTALVDAVLLVALLACIVGLYRLCTWYIDLPPALRSAFWHSVGREVSPPRLSVLSNPNIMAAYLVLLLPLGVYRWSRFRSRLRRRLGSLALSLAVLILLLTRSRGGAIGLGAVALTGLWMMRHRVSARQRVALLGAFLALALGIGLVLAQRGVTLTQGSGEVRLESWRVALVVLREHPLLGSGPGTFGAQLLHYRNPLRLQEIHAHAHNMYLTLGAETGAVGLLAAAWMALAFVGALRRRPNPAPGFTLDRAGIVGLVGWAAHSLVDSFLDKPMVPLYALFLATLVLLERGAVSFRRAPRRLMVVTVLCVIVAGATVWVNQGHAALHAARVAASEGDWQGAAQWLDRAVALDPDNWFYRQGRAFTYGVLACEDPQELPGAIAGYEAYLRRFDDWAPDHANLAALRHEAGQPTHAVRAINRARQLEPDRPMYDCLLGRYMEAAGRTEEALDAYATCLARSPQWASSPFWEETPWRASARSRILARALEIAAEEGDLVVQASLRAAAGYTDQALVDLKAHLATHPNDVTAQIEAARILAWSGRRDEALRWLDKVLARAPTNGGAWMIRGWIDLEEGATEQAVEDLTTAAALRAGADLYYLLGRLAEAQGDAETAILYYEAAIEQTMHPLISDFAPWVAHRLPLPAEWLPCLRPPHPYEDFAAPVLALGRLLEEQGRCAQAADLYRLALEQEPGLSAVEQRLRQPNCSPP